MRPSLARTAAALALLLAAAGCAGARSGVVYNSNFTAGYDPRSLGAAMSRAPLLVETYGIPAPGVAQESVSRSSATALRQYGPSWLPRNYTASADDAGRGAYKLRIAYAMPKAFDRQRLCTTDMSVAQMDAARGQNETGSTRTVASLCRGETALGVAEGSPGANPDIAGDSFARFVGALGRAVMPRRNPVLDDDCIFRFCN